MLLNSRKHNPASFKVIINNHNISPEDNLKYLGVLLDKKLSWKSHVQKVNTQQSRVCESFIETWTLHNTICTESCL